MWMKQTEDKISTNINVLKGKAFFINYKKFSAYTQWSFHIRRPYFCHHFCRTWRSTDPIPRGKQRRQDWAGLLVIQMHLFFHFVPDQTFQISTKNHRKFQYNQLQIKKSMYPTRSIALEWLSIMPSNSEDRKTQQWTLLALFTQNQIQITIRCSPCNFSSSTNHHVLLLWITSINVNNICNIFTMLHRSYALHIKHNKLPA